jgi:cell division protein FtsI/penicillin-binding protein 2
LQVLEKAHTVALATDSNRFTLSRVEYAKRGTIWSSDMKPLAEDAQSYHLNVQFNDLPKSTAFYMDLAEATGIPASEFAAIAESGVKSKTWLDPMSEGQKQSVQTVRSRWRAGGVSVSPADQRTYPLGPEAAGLVGAIRDYRKLKKGTGVDGVPAEYYNAPSRTGIEASKNDLLSGQNGLRVGLTDRTGAFLPMRMDDRARQKVDGKDITLTIDSELQAAAAQSVKKAVVEHSAVNGAAIVIDPKTGDILAMANYPTFDPNTNANQNGVNAAYQAQLEPGSMFKILTLAKGLDVGKISMNDQFFCHGEFHPTRSTTVHCDAHHGNRAHGLLNPIGAIAKSCNVCAATWALKIGREDMIDYIEKLGVLEKTDVGVPNEVHGLFRRDEYAKTLQLAHVGFGQSITSTPLALASAFTMLGNDGVLMPPRLIKKIGAKDVPLGEGRKIVKAEVAHEVTEAMEAVIESDSGTGKSLRIPGYRLGGKTGTAEKVGAKQHGYVSNFIGFVPAQQPRAVILVMINDPKRGYYGATVAGPAFKSIAESVIRRMNLPPDAPYEAMKRR